MIVVNLYFNCYCSTNAYTPCFLRLVCEARREQRIERLMVKGYFPGEGVSQDGKRTV
jgi:hypothetical protein